MNALPTLTPEARASETRPAARRRPDRPRSSEDGRDFAAAVAAAEMAHTRPDRPERAEVDPTPHSGEIGAADEVASTDQSADTASTDEGEAVEAGGTSGGPTASDATDGADAVLPSGAPEAVTESVAAAPGVAEPGATSTHAADGATPEQGVLDGVQVLPTDGTPTAATPPAATVLAGGASTPAPDGEADDDAGQDAAGPSAEPVEVMATDAPIEPAPTAAPTAGVAAAAAGSSAPSEGGADPIAPTGPAAGQTQAARAAGAAEATDSTPPPWRQVAAALRTVREADGGPQVLSLELAPANLGRVRVEATLRDGVLDVKLHAETDRAHQALQTGMAELRRDVEAAGVRSGRLEVQPFDRTSGDHTGDALDGHRPGAQGPFADVEPGVGGDGGTGRWRAGADGPSPGGSGARPSSVVAEPAAARDLSDHRLDLHL